MKNRTIRKREDVQDPSANRNKIGRVGSRCMGRYELAVAVTALLLGLAVTLVFLWAPEARGLGLDFKIFFFHVPAAWLMLLSAIVAGSAAARSLVSGGPDHLAAAAVDLAVVFGFIVLITGPLWAWRAWGKPWIWEPRLTTSLVCWLTYAMALVVRASGPGGARTALLLSLLGAFEVPMVYLSVRWWAGGHHPPTSLVPSLSGRYAAALLVCLLAASALWGLLLNLALRHRKNLNNMIRLEALAKACDKAGLVLVMVGAVVLSAPRTAKASPLGGTNNRIETSSPTSVTGRTSGGNPHTVERTGSDETKPGSDETKPGSDEGFSPYPPSGPKTAEGPTRGTIAAVLAAYLAFWGILFVYILVLARRNRTIEERIEALTRRLETNRAGVHSVPKSETQGDQRRSEET